MSLLKRRHPLEVLVAPRNPTDGSLAELGWLDADSARIRVGGHEVRVESTKDGLELTYVQPKTKRAEVSLETSPSVTRLRIRP